MSDERGFTLIEMLVSVAIGMVILIAAFNLIDASTNATARVTSRVDANQRARPAMQRVIDELNSSCVVQDLAPVQAGSDNSTLVLLTQTGASVAPVPDQHVIAFAAAPGTLTDTTYPVSGGIAPSWTFATTPSATRVLLDRVSNATSGSPSVSVPVFQYFAYAGNQLSTTPLATPLTVASAATVSEVTVSFAAASTTAAIRDPNQAVSLADSATLRLTAASDNPANAALPCT